MAEAAVIERSIGDIGLEVTIEEKHDDSLTITEHPVEDGAAISDHAYKNPMAVTITAGTSGKAGDGVPVETYEKLLALQESREPFSIITGKREYENMLIQGIGVTTDADTGNVLMVTLDCREVIIVSTETAQVPASRQGQAAKTQKTRRAGTKQASEGSDSDETGAKKKSIIKSIVG